MGQTGDSSGSGSPSCSPRSSSDISWPLNMKGAANDVPVPRGKAAQKISDLLGQVPSDEFCFGGLAYLLPILPGLSVSSVGTVSLPLRREMAEQLKPRTSEEWCQAWEIRANQVTMKNPEWERGVQMLCAFSAEKLGYKDVTLEPRLSRVLVCGPGGQVERQLGVKSETGQSVATLVVQPPSEYTGGALVVSRDGAGDGTRYEFGNGAAAFRPHYIVFAAGSCCCAETVETGYRPVMEYELVLPSHVPLDYRKRSSMILLGKMADAVKQLKSNPDEVVIDESGPGKSESAAVADGGIVAFVLAKSYNQVSLEKRGWEILSGVDRDRLQLLKDANTLLPSGNQLKFYFARFSVRTKEVISWHSMSGEAVRNGTATATTKAFNVLNPDNVSLGQLWNNAMPDCDHLTVVVMWPRMDDISNTVSLMGMTAAVPNILERDVLDITTVRALLVSDALGWYEFALAVQTSNHDFQMLLVCQKLVPVIIQSGEVKLVKPFFKKYFDLLIEGEKTEFLPWLRILARDFGWQNVGTAILAAIDCSLHETSLNRALILADMLSESPTAQSALTEFAAEKAQLMCRVRPDALAFSSSTGLLWKHAVACTSTTPFSTVKNLAALTNPKNLGSIVNELSKHVNSSSLPEHQATLASIAWARRQWLIDEVLGCEKPFTWHVPNASFPHSAEILAFLEAPTRSLVIPNLTSMSKARLLTVELYRQIQAPLSITAERQGQEVVVQISKTGGQFDTRRDHVPQYMAEIQRLGQLLPLDDNASSSNVRNASEVTGSKRRRTGDSEVITID